MNDQMPRYNQAVIDWKSSVDDYEIALLEAAESEAKHKAARAKVIVRLRATDAKMSHALAESVGDSDDEVIALAQIRLVKGAAVEGLKARLLWHRALADNLRTQVVDERASNAFQSQAGAGPGRTTFDPGPPRSQHPQQGPPRAAPPPQRQQEPPRRPSSPEQRPTPPTTPPPSVQPPTGPSTVPDRDENGWRY